MKTCVIEFRLYSFLPAVQNFGQIQHGECCPGNGIRRAQYFSPPLPPHHHHGRWLRLEERGRRPINNNNNNAQWFSTTHSEQWEFEPTINFSRTERFTFCFAGFVSVFVFELTVMLLIVMVTVSGMLNLNLIPRFQDFSHIYTCRSTSNFTSHRQDHCFLLFLNRQLTEKQ